MLLQAFPLRGRCQCQLTDEVDGGLAHLLPLLCHLISHFVTASPQGEALFSKICVSEIIALQR